ncbi:MAG: hypothetical protein KF852_06125 [Saprospiraceae bacterium]|nr:hypothetical protein [Saprospiraceae bacterium]
MKKISIFLLAIGFLHGATPGRCTAYQPDTTLTGNYIVLEAGTPVSLTLYSEASSARLQEGNTVELDVKISVVVNGREVIRARDYAEGRVRMVRKAGILGRAGALEIEAVSVRAIDGQIVHLHGTPHTAKGHSRKGAAIGLSAATTVAGLAILDKKTKGASVGFVFTGLFVKGQEAVIEKDIILRAYVAQPTKIRIF